MAIDSKSTIEEPLEFEAGHFNDAELQFSVRDSGELHDEECYSVEELRLISRPEWQLASRIAASKGLAKSELLPRFLLYVCRESLLGREREITEQRIGTQIFKRPSDYNPGEDNIVRSYARTLRKRLDAYFDGEGSQEEMRISIPRGGYAPSFYSVPEGRQWEPRAEEPDLDRGTAAESDAVFDLRLAAEIEEEGASCSRETGEGRGKVAMLSWRRGLVPAAAGLAAGVLLTLAAWFGGGAIQSRNHHEPAHALWAGIFGGDRTTFIIPADSGLGILENLAGREVGIEEYANGSYLSGSSNLSNFSALSAAGLTARLGEGEFNDLRNQRYTSLVDLDIANHLTRLPEAVADRTEIRYARNFAADDMKHSNLILLGSKHTNPWVSLFEPKLNFQLVYTPETNASYVRNQHPARGEEAVYRNSTGKAPGPTYGVIAYLPETDGAGHVLILEGLNMAATQAAADVLFNAGDIGPGGIGSVLQKATGANGTLMPFELLVETTSIGAAAPGSRILATRIYGL